MLFLLPLPPNTVETGGQYWSAIRCSMQVGDTRYRWILTLHSADLLRRHACASRRLLICRAGE